MTITSDVIKNTAGLVMWLDGEINSRAGVRNTSINGMQNLVYTPFAGKSSTVGFYEKFNGTPTFSEKGCKLGGTCHYPSYELNNNVTVEFVVHLGKSAISNKVHSVVDTRSTTTGFQVYIGNGLDTDGFAHIHFVSGNNAKDIVATSTNAKIYCAVTSNLLAANSTKMYINGKLTTLSGSDGIGKAKTAIMPIALGGMSSSSMDTSTPTTSNQWGMGAFYAPNDIFHTVRLWNRQLSEKEILDNYKRDFERFGA